MNELRKKRKELGMTQIDAARTLGVSRRTYQTYEEENASGITYDQLLEQITQLGLEEGSNAILGIRLIKQNCKMVFERYPKVKCAYLFGSYARGQASANSDIDLLVVCEPMGMEFLLIGADLQDALHKEIDMLSYEQLLDNESLLKEVLMEGVKIYG